MTEQEKRRLYFYGKSFVAADVGERSFGHLFLWATLAVGIVLLIIHC